MAAITTVRGLAELALKELGADAPTTAVVMRVAARLATTVNSWPGLHGSEKQTIVLATLREVLTSEAVRSRMEPAAHATLLATVDTVVPETLALVVAAGRGEIDLRRPSVGCAARFAALLCRAVAVAAPLSEEERRTLGMVASAVSSVADPVVAPGDAPAVPAVADPASPAVPPSEKESEETPAGESAAAPTATESTPASEMPATPTESQPST
jgi:hypothetical protein